MSAPIDKPHLKYESIEAWMEGEDIPTGFFTLADDVLRDRYLTQYAELRRHLFAKHVLTLTLEEQAQFEQGEHPSQSHEFAARAQPIAEDFERELRKLGIAARVALSFYHGDQIRLSVYVPTLLTLQESDKVPELFRGFVVGYYLEDSAES